MSELFKWIRTSRDMCSKRLFKLIYLSQNQYCVMQSKPPQYYIQYIRAEKKLFSSQKKFNNHKITIDISKK